MAWNQPSPPSLGIAQQHSIYETIFQSAGQHLRVVSRTVFKYPLNLNSSRISLRSSSHSPGLGPGWLWMPLIKKPDGSWVPSSPAVHHQKASYCPVFYCLPITSPLTSSCDPMTTLEEQVLYLHTFCTPFTKTALEPQWELYRCLLNHCLFVCCPKISPHPPPPTVPAVA